MDTTDGFTVPFKKWLFNCYLDVALECAGFLTGLGFETAVMVRSAPLARFDQVQIFLSVARIIIIILYYNLCDVVTRPCHYRNSQSRDSVSILPFAEKLSDLHNFVIRWKLILLFGLFCSFA